MEEYNSNNRWKTVQRTWKDASASCSRKCRVPKKLIIFALIVCGIFMYTVLNNNVLHVSYELTELQNMVNIEKSFETVKLNIDKPIVMMATISESEIDSRNNQSNDSINQSISKFAMNPKKEELWNGKNRLRIEKPDTKATDISEIIIDRNSSFVIEGTLSQILPSVLGDDVRPKGFSSSYRFSYPAFVIPPPFTIETNRRNTLPAISKFFQELTSHKKDDCVGEDICVHPSKYVHLYTKWDCSEKKCGSDKDYIVYFQNQYTHGSVDVVDNGVVTFNFDCGCFSKNLEAITSSSTRIYDITGKLVFLLIPDGATFFHFIDGILPKLVQLESFISDPSIRFLIDLSPQYPIVKELFSRLGISDSRLINYREIKHLGDSVRATRLILPCITPPLHPYLWQRAQYLLKLPHIQFPEKYTQNCIIYLTRRKGTMSGGRRVMNESDLKTHLQRYAEACGYRFVEFNHGDYKKLDDNLELWSSALAIIGPHGGAFYNMMFSPKGTLVIEFLPNGSIFTGPTFKEHLYAYQQAMLMGHKYYSVMSAFSKRDDLNVSIRDVMGILKQELISCDSV